MHRALLISEVVRHICHGGLLSTHEPEERAALAALARTARALNEPAIEALWSILEYEGMARLVRCMPPDLWVCEWVGHPELSLGTKTLRFVRDIVPSDWNRLLFYAQYVREVKGLTLRPDELRDRFVGAFLTQWPGITLFPNLRCFEYREHSGDRLPLSLMLKPGTELKRLHLNIDPNDGLPMFKFIANLHLPLEHLQVTYPEDARITLYVECPAIFLSMLEALPGLRTLRLDLPWTWFSGAAVHLSSLPCLETLSIETRNNNEDHDAVKRPASPRWPSLPFPSLRRLKLYTWEERLLGFSAAMHSMWPPGFTVFSLQLFLDDGTSDNNPNRYIQIICDIFDPTGIKELSVKRYFGNYYDTDWNIESSLIQPLLAFTNLESLSVEWDRLSIGNALLKKIAEAWPALKCLSIVSVPLYSFDCGQCVTADGLSDLASSCPGLLALTCRIDLRDAQIFLQSSDNIQNKPKYRNNQLQLLMYTVNSLFSSATSAAIVLSTLFPRLRTVPVLVDVHPPFTGRSETIETILKDQARIQRGQWRAFRSQCLLTTSGSLALTLLGPSCGGT